MVILKELDFFLSNIEHSFFFSDLIFIRFQRYKSQQLKFH